METLNIEIVNPKAKKLLRDLSDLNLIHIKTDKDFALMLDKLRENEHMVPDIEAISKEVEYVRNARYAHKN